LKQVLARCAQGWCPWHVLLLPLSWLFRLLSGLRRAAYRLGWLKQTRLPVPVIVVGNITAGGSGKTPLVIWLARVLREAGWRPGVISRGYGGRGAEPMPATASADPARVGDEPVLIARAAGVPVWVGRRRVEAGRALLARHPEVDVLLADDGLQHYALARDLEIAVVDARRRFGNGRLLPAGPLREPIARLGQADAVVVNGGVGEPAAGAVPQFAMTLRPARLHSLNDPARTAEVATFRGRTVRAVAGIGDPERFFATLRVLGMEVVPHAFPDHHAFVAADLPAGTVVMTAKDAVKCEAFQLPDAWVLEVDAVLAGGLQEMVLTRLQSPSQPLHHP
jgi:tetraacyldisaccharide 4'-kinase